MAQDTNISYFIAKCANIYSLKTCIDTCSWACKDRVSSSLHPKDILSQAFKNRSKVIIIFSVNNCHGWHGYAEMISCPSVDSAQNESHSQNHQQTGLEKEEPSEDGDMKNNELLWYYFQVKWITEYLTKFGEQCLSFQNTSSMSCVDKTPLNKARNWNEIDFSTGQQICSLIDDHYNKLQTKQQEKEKQQESRLPPPFVHPSCNSDDFNENWSQLVNKVQQELGKVLLACPFGSQRYNLDTINSDMDMFVVYQADTKALLGFNRNPPQTVKSSEREALDYTVHEVYRYGELLLAGDHRCVETLFLHSSSYVELSDFFKELLQNRNLFLNKSCLEKYLRDALGNKGLKLLEKWIKGKPLDEKMTERECKLSYIIIRLLQNAKNIVDKDSLKVYRPHDSPERKFLISLKTVENTPTIGYCLDEINRLKTYIEDKKENVPEASEELKLFMNDWIINLRRIKL